MSAPEKPDLVLGFTPLTDCAPLIVALEHGHFERYGLRVALSCEPSWANIRDKLAAGVLDGAQMLAPMPIASTLGVGPLHQAMVTALSLGLNGNTITVSTELARSMAEADPQAMATVSGRARALARVVAERSDIGAARLRFASVFPVSMHAYHLRRWFASAGLRAERDLRLVVQSPVRMVAELEAGAIDGFCVGEPWGSLAVARGSGSSLLATHELWNCAPEKVLGVRLDFAERHPETHLALVCALLEAARWCDAHENRPKLARMLADGGFVRAPASVLALSESHVFHRYAANFPWRSHAIWIIAEMLRWGQIEKPLDVRTAAASVYRTDLAREAASRLGLAVPQADEKREGTHAEPWQAAGTTGPITLGPDLFFDGSVFDPGDPVGYLARCEVSDLRFPLEELEALQA
ncbi:MAG: CmpA/NrtA family ABC transporter substrate-binding protein [Myxococcota bacterium]